MVGDASGLYQLISAHGLIWAHISSWADIGSYQPMGYLALDLYRPSPMVKKRPNIRYVVLQNG